MAGIPQNFQSISPVIANYDFVDIASGTGYINFYAGNTVDLKLLSNFQYYSDSLYLTNNVESITYVLVHDIDFDTVLNRPLDVRGIGIVNIPFGSTNTEVDVYCEVYVRKWDGATETEIASNTSSTFDNTIQLYNMFAVDVNIPLTHFKIGETLRLTIKVYAKGQNTAAKSIQIGCDPKSRTSAGLLDWDASGEVPSQLTFLCPVRLNL